MTDIIFPASVAQVKTMADGSLRFVFDVPETAIMQAAQLMECKRWGVVLEVICKTVMEQSNGEKQRDVATGTKRKSEWKAAEATGAD